jgi:hypothetical protein
LEEKTLETMKLSKELKSTHSNYQLGIIIAAVCIFVFNFVIGVGCCCFKYRREERDQDTKTFTATEITTEKYEHGLYSLESISREPAAVTSSRSSNILSRKMVRLNKYKPPVGAKLDNVSAWKLKKYFKVIHEEGKENIGNDQYILQHIQDYETKIKKHSHQIPHSISRWSV